jgi:hypothetical protein
MNKFRYLSAAAGVAAIVFAATVFAQTVAPSTSPSASPATTVPQGKTDKKLEKADAKNQKTAARTQKLEQQKKDLIRKYFSQMKHRNDVLIRALENVADRIGSRLDNMQNAGINVATPKTKLAAAREELNAAKADLASASGTIRVILADAQNPKDVFALAKDAVQSFMNRVKKIHRSLIDIVISIKGMPEKPHQSASATPTVSSSVSASPSLSPIPSTSASATPSATPFASASPSPSV